MRVVAFVLMGVFLFSGIIVATDLILGRYGK
jgi:hypothetical protein